MAISNLGGKNRWVEIASSSPTSGTSVSFTSIPQYGRLQLVWFALDTNTSNAALFYATFNNDTGSNYAYGKLAENSTPVTRLVTTGKDTNINFGGLFTASQGSGKLLIEQANEIFKTISFSHFTGVINSDQPSCLIGDGIWNSSSAVDRIDLTINAGTFKSGTIKLYGSN
jgi:hypothetical protein